MLRGMWAGVTVAVLGLVVLMTPLVGRAAEALSAAEMQAVRGREDCRLQPDTDKTGDPTKLCIDDQAGCPGFGPEDCVQVTKYQLKPEGPDCTVVINADWIKLDGIEDCWTPGDCCEQDDEGTRYYAKRFLDLAWGDDCQPPGPPPHPVHNCAGNAPRACAFADLYMDDSCVNIVPGPHYSVYVCGCTPFAPPQPLPSVQYPGDGECVPSM